MDALIVALSRLAPDEVSHVVVALVGRMDPREWAEVWREVAMGVAGSAAAQLRRQ